MLETNKLFEISNIEDLSTRTQMLLDEVQPEVRQIMARFINKYSEKDTYLNELRVHTYEDTLKSISSTSNNSKSREKIHNQGKKVFIELIDDHYYESPIVILRLEINLQTKDIRLCMTSDFYPFMRNVRPTKVNKIEQMIKEMDADIEIFTNEDDKETTSQDLFVERVKEYVKNKQRPNLCFGKIYSFNHVISEEELTDELWHLYEKLESVRNLVVEEVESHSEAVRLLSLFGRNSKPFNITIYSKNYQVVLEEELKKVKANEYKQSFSIYDKDQLITTGHFVYGYRPNEFIGVIINKFGHLFSNVRPIANSRDTYEWYNKKSFYQRGKYKENQLHQERSVQELKNHGFTLNHADAFYVGTYERLNYAFTEPIEMIKERLLTASAIFADIRDMMTFPKGDVDSSNYEESIDEDDEDNEVGGFSSSFNFSTILDFVEQSGFTFSIDIVRDFYLNLTSLEDKHFVILNGISGTGKTQLCRVFANAIYGLDYSEDHPYLKIVPVRPDWTDGTALFGYYSSFEKRYMRTEFLDMLIQANKEKDKPHFVVLDEMNLARVEYYLSDYLSGVESRKPIQLHTIAEVTDVPKTIEIPHNFYLIGTINTDETTHSISDKVLDRSFVMTLSEVNFEAFWDTIDTKVKETIREEWSFLLKLHVVLSEFELHFGYRTMNEILRKLYKNYQLPEEFRMDKWVGLDRVISEKVLPKLRGDERIEGLLIQLHEMFTNRFSEESESVNHIVRMRKELERYGATQFWG